MGITRKEALDCFQSDDLIGIGMEADAVRRRLHPENVITYALDGRIDYTTHTNEDTYSQILAITARMEAKGATALTLHGKITPTHTIHWFKSLFSTLRQRFPGIELHSLSASEIQTLATHSGSTIYDTLSFLREAGLDSIPGNDAGTQITLEDWLAIHRTAHSLGMQTTASMTFSTDEIIEDSLNHLTALRRLQEETGGFTSFTPQPIAANIEEPTAVEYLKTLAISRIYLDNIPNIQADLETQGLKVLQVSLRFGANDAGSILLAGGANAATEEQVCQAIRDAGFKPVQRDARYATMFFN